MCVYQKGGRCNEETTALANLGDVDTVLDEVETHGGGIGYAREFNDYVVKGLSSSIGVADKAPHCRSQLACLGTAAHATVFEFDHVHLAI